MSTRTRSLGRGILVPQGVAKQLPESTITVSERVIFDRLFKDLVTGEKPATDLRDDSDFESLEEEGSEYESLESIFNDAVRKVESRPKKAPSLSNRPVPKETPKSSGQPQGGLIRRIVSNSSISFRAVFPPSLQQFLDTARETYAAHRFKQRDAASPTSLRGSSYYEVWHPEVVGEVAKEPLDEYERLVRYTRKNDMSRISALLEAASTDIEIWRVLEKEVFSKMSELNALLKKEEKVKRAATPKPKGRAPKKVRLVNTIPATSVLASDLNNTIPSKITSRSEQDSIEPTVEESIVKDSTDSSSQLAPSVALQPTSILQTTPHPLSILQTNYAPLLFHAMRLLRTRFPASTYALALIPHIKRLGPVSYVLGASIALYNETLYLQWVYYRDLHACADLVQEMVEQGIGTDNITGKVFKDAERVRRKAKWGTGSDFSGNGQESTKVSIRWWKLQGVRSGWERWREAEGEAARERDEEMKRMQREKAEMEGDEEDTDTKYVDLNPDPDIALVGDVGHSPSSTSELNR
ncbi:hypothetical protein MMC11_007304 [Xylographa trunciseda]|nr:hypothetical protein [Xylographa trunciseda]